MSRLSPSESVFVANSAILKAADGAKSFAVTKVFCQELQVRHSATHGPPGASSLDVATWRLRPIPRAPEE